MLRYRFVCMFSMTLLPGYPDYPGYRGFRGRGLHSSTFQLNLSTLCGIGVAVRGCLGGV